MNFNKLVRDKIPEIIEAQGEKAITRVLDTEEYLKCLETKLEEEVSEYRESKTLEELADILEVVFALSEATGYSQEALLAACTAKRAQRGGFANRIFLIAKE